MCPPGTPINARSVSERPRAGARICHTQLTSSLIPQHLHSLPKIRSVLRWAPGRQPLRLVVAGDGSALVGSTPRLALACGPCEPSRCPRLSVLQVEEWGPFDLLYGATPPLGHTCDHPPSWYLFQFHRLLQYARPGLGSPRPFFWMFVDNLVLNKEDQDVASRFLEMEPTTIPDVRGGSLQNAVRVWSNIPAIRSSRQWAPVSEEELSLLTQNRQSSKLAAKRPTNLVKNCFLPLREYF
ncbi:hypothetical protein H8959_013661, partial [Pygathrix nigripes]